MSETTFDMVSNAPTAPIRYALASTDTVLIVPADALDLGVSLPFWIRVNSEVMRVTVSTPGSYPPAEGQVTQSASYVTTDDTMTVTSTDFMWANAEQGLVHDLVQIVDGTPDPSATIKVLDIIDSTTLRVSAPASMGTVTYPSGTAWEAREAGRSDATFRQWTVQRGQRGTVAVAHPRTSLASLAFGVSDLITRYDARPRLYPALLVEAVAEDYSSEWIAAAFTASGPASQFEVSDLPQSLTSPFGGTAFVPLPAGACLSFQRQYFFNTTVTAEMYIRRVTTATGTPIALAAYEECHVPGTFSAAGRYFDPSPSFTATSDVEYSAAAGAPKVLTAGTYSVTVYAYPPVT